MDMTVNTRNSDEEVWESNVPGRTSVEVINRATGNPTKRSVKGVGQRLRLTTLDRELAEEVMRSPEHNPFRNGVLRQVAGPTEEAGAEHLSDEQLAAIFSEADSSEEFQELIAGMGEINIRRMMAMTTPVDASLSQTRALEDLIAERFPIGGTTPTYEEMMGNPKLFEGEPARGTRLR